jgi:hypothetical protein
VVDGRQGEDGSVKRVTGGDGVEPAGTYPYRVLDTDPTTGEPCTRWRIVVATTPEQTQLASADARALDDAWSAQVDLADPPPPCSDIAIDPGAPARQAAQDVIGQLTAAEPYVQPDNRAITGIWSYLRTNIDSDFERTVTVTLFGRDWDVQVDVEGVHTIDWGDGTIDTGVRGDGGPWHEGEPGPGDIAHGYIATGAHSLVVTTDWTVTATLPATGATATQTLTTTSTPVTIDVDEVRSVRDR